MAKLTSLKMSKKEAKSDMGMPMGASDMSGDNLPRYPYGTKVRLEKEALDKLDCDPADYKVGDVLMIQARVEVVGTSIRENQGGKEYKELELQITDMSMEQDKATKKAKAEDEHMTALSKTTTKEEY